MCLPAGGSAVSPFRPLPDSSCIRSQLPIEMLTFLPSSQSTLKMALLAQLQRLIKMWLALEPALTFVPPGSRFPGTAL
jgi:hypothetical protein